MQRFRRFRRDFSKAWHKATHWGSPPPQAFLVALRYALKGDSGRFLPPKGSQSYRILKH